MISQLLTNQRRLFWVLQLGGWAAWGLFGKYLILLAYSEEVAPGYHYYVAVISFIGVLITLGLRYLYRHFWGRPLWIQALSFFVGSFAAAQLWIRSRALIFNHYFKSEKSHEAWLEKFGEAAEMVERIYYIDGVWEFYIAPWTVMLIWSALYFSIKYYRIFQEVRESALKSAAMAHEAQLKMLRYQLNPHFLFNTLNAISTLVLEKHTDLANRMVTKLSSFLRFSLDNDPMQKITLKQELVALKLYLDIEKVRFEERLNLDIDIGEEANRALIPSLLLQPLVENAVKYGIARSEEGGNLRIAARVFAGDLLLELSDDGPGVELQEGQIPDANGVGLRNTRERLQELYGSHHSIRLSQTDPHGLTISIRIPHETGQG
jgi:hypothetical protein